jgi:membrane protein involved in D-alanine export
MLPYSIYEFYLVMAGMIALLYGAKKFSGQLDYRWIQGLFNFSFLIFFYPKPLHFILLIVYAWFMTYLLHKKIKPRKKIWGILLLLLPMLLVKLDIRFGHYPFELNHLLSFAGLSYASFRMMGCYLDLAPEDAVPGQLDYFNFLSFTPTLLIGPIDKFSRFRESLKNGWQQLNSDAFLEGWHSFLKGFSFKYLLAEIIDRYWLGLFDAADPSMPAMINSMYAYYVYLFFDFAGYSHMALGLGKMMGMKVPVNFTNPFVARNPQEFWRSFHISLGDWLKDYFFSPLYLFFSRKKKLKAYPLLRQNLSLFLTFLLMGCWNGFSKNFILSGALFGLYSAVHNTYTVQCKKQGRDIIFSRLSETSTKIISIFILFNLVAFALYIFSGRFPLL